MSSIRVHEIIGDDTWKIESAEALDFFLLRNRHLRFRVRQLTERCRKHLQTDYRDAAGAKRLGFHPIKPVLMLSNYAGTGYLHPDCVVACHEGYISRDEAVGSEYIPTPDEIREKAKAIRAENDAAGIVRKPDTVGFDIGRTYKAPLVAFAG